MEARTEPRSFVVAVERASSKPFLFSTCSLTTQAFLFCTPAQGIPMALRCLWTLETDPTRRLRASKKERERERVADLSRHRFFFFQAVRLIRSKKTAPLDVDG